MAFLSVSASRTCATRVVSIVLISLTVVAGTALADGVLSRPSLVMTPAVLEALDANARGVATPQQHALLFRENDVVNRARLNNWISDSAYQAAQRDFAARNEAFARAAAEQVAGPGSFRQQAAKPGRPKIYAPGTDSDYIIQVSSPDQVRQMQNGYRQRIDQYLGANNVLDGRGQNWARKLDTDFMADPSGVTRAEFEQIARMNNAAYSRQGAAEYERISRAGGGIKVDPELVRSYGEQMTEFARNKRSAVERLRNDPQAWSDRRLHADVSLMMAQGEKYIERIEAATDLVRRQNGLSTFGRDRATEPFSVVTDPDTGATILRKRVALDAEGNPVFVTERTGSMSTRGSNRSPENILDVHAANAVAANSLNRAVGQLAETYIEAGRTNVVFRGNAPADIAALTRGLPMSEKGFILENIRRVAREGFQADGMSRTEAARWAGRLTENVATEMRKLAPQPPTDGSLRQGFKRAFEEGQRIARREGATPGTPLEATRALDSMIKQRLKLPDNAGATRQQFNQLADKYLPGVNRMVGGVFMARDLYATGQSFGHYLDELSVCMDGTLSDAEANIHCRAAEEASREMIATGVAGVGFGVVLGAFPTVGAALGTYTLAFDGTRWLLENTETGQRFDQAMGRAAETVVESIDRLAGNNRTEPLGALERRRFQSYLSAIDRGDLEMQPGVTYGDLFDAFDRGESLAALLIPRRGFRGLQPNGPPPLVVATTPPPVGPLGLPPGGQGGVPPLGGQGVERGGAPPPGQGPGGVQTGGPVRAPVPPTFEPNNSNCQRTTGDPTKGQPFATGRLTDNVGADFSPPCPPTTADRTAPGTPPPAKPPATATANPPATPPATGQRDRSLNLPHEPICQDRDPLKRERCLEAWRREQECRRKPELCIGLPPPDRLTYDPPQRRAGAPPPGPTAQPAAPPAAPAAPQAAKPPATTTTATTTPTEPNKVAPSAIDPREAERQKTQGDRQKEAERQKAPETERKEAERQKALEARRQKEAERQKELAADQQKTLEAELQTAAREAELQKREVQIRQELAAERQKVAELQRREAQIRQELAAERQKVEELQRREAQQNALAAERQSAAEGERRKAAEAERQRAMEAEQQRALAAERQRVAEAERQRAQQAERQRTATIDARANINGRWVGFHQCGDVRVGTMAVINVDAAGRLSGTRSFYPTQSDPHANGSFQISGNYQYSTGDFSMIAGNWIQQVPRSKCNLVGRIDPTGRVLHGSSSRDCGECTYFQLVRQ
jgi:hypothetical protein